jgi:hypothetical protein
VTKEIPLSKGKVALVDDEDYELLHEHRWHMMSTGYAARNRSLKQYTQPGLILMHRVIVGAKKGQYVDHVNGDKLDNRRSNLRICTQSQNSANRRLDSNNTSGAKGVSWCKERQKWQVHIRVKGKQLNLGRYDDFSEACAAYDAAAIKYFGEFARTNADLSSAQATP